MGSAVWVTMGSNVSGDESSHPLPFRSTCKCSMYTTLSLKLQVEEIKKFHVGISMANAKEKSF